jgi:hypothetical protein
MELFECCLRVFHLQNKIMFLLPSIVCINPPEFILSFFIFMKDLFKKNDLFGKMTCGSNPFLLWWIFLES